jgi:hypothetical protein
MGIHEYLDGYVSIPEERLVEMNKQLDWADSEVGKLRAVLAPLLENPFDEGMNYFCRFCDMRQGEGHTPECPVLRKDELLHARYPDAIKSGR